MNWEQCVQTNVKKRTPNPEEARSLYEMAAVRQKDNDRRERTEDTISLIVETYWEIDKQLITALLNLNGYKSYSQDCLIAFLETFYDLQEDELELLDQLRRLRNDIDYRGAFLDEDYLDRNEDRIKDIITTLERHVEAELDDRND